ncbi:MAG: glycosyltransferase family 39 protein [Bacteroidia bacterium]|nr:glycosyltransferase family 39 protein [Bacteroidia bacterium]
MFKQILSNRQTPFWLIAFSTMIGLTLPTLIQDGMFMDAVLYTSVSHNLSMGIGTFWFPQFSLHNVAGLSSFHEQPPLVFGIQSLFFKLLGDSLYVERFYTFLTMCLGGVLINVLWKEIFRNDDNLKRIGWLPVILWITIPVCFWSYSHNMHENTMSIFTLAAVIFIYQSFRGGKFQVILWILSGIFIFLATLSKGLPGFFPIIVPLIYWAIIRKVTFSKTILQTLIITLVPIIIYAVLFLIPESKESLSVYLFKRVLPRINEVPTVDNRFYILYRLFTELLPQILFVVIIVAIARIKRIKIYLSEQICESVFFICVGLASSAPLMLTLVQKGFYFVPSLPFFAIGLSVLIGPVIVNLTKRINPDNKKFRILLLLSLLLFVTAISITLMQKGKASRNKELLHDVYLIGTVVPRQTTISIPREMWNDWGLQCYLARYFSISLEGDYKKRYYLIDKSLKLDRPAGYQKINIPTWQYLLYVRQQDNTKQADGE